MEYPILSVAISLLLILTQVISKNSPDCPKLYQRFSTSHSYCQPKNPSCNILRSNLAQKDVNQILHLHNNYRSAIATQQKESKGLPPAADMILMEWDKELAEIAQRRADQCIYEHDEPNQRRVKNFGVGQNIGQQGSSVQVSQPDWSWAIGNFFKEIEFFRSSMVCGDRTQAEGEIGHFTQLVWSSSFRIGCGYTMYKEGDTYYRLYVCNYGPHGNYAPCVYTEGKACSKCPKNTQCSTGSQYPGLCQRTNGDGPYQPMTEPHSFVCDLSSRDCGITGVEGANSWSIVSALGGSYLETVLQAGQSSTITFAKHIIPFVGADRMCIHIFYRLGPNLAKDQLNNSANTTVIAPMLVYSYTFPLNRQDDRQIFANREMNLPYNSETEVKISFAVPNRASPQFFNIQSVFAKKGICPR